MVCNKGGEQSREVYTRLTLNSNLLFKAGGQEEFLPFLLHCLKSTRRGQAEQCSSQKQVCFRVLAMECLNNNQSLKWGTSGSAFSLGSNTDII